MTIGNVHLNDDGYGYPIGALGIAAAVVRILGMIAQLTLTGLNQIERGLKLVSSGHVKVHEGAERATTLEGTTGKKRKVNGYEGYTDVAWGEITRSWVCAGKRLNAEKWRDILTAAVSNVDFSNMDEAEEVRDHDPRAMIDI